MAILTTYDSFRYHFADRNSITLSDSDWQFVASSPPTLVRLDGGSFVTAGFYALTRFKTSRSGAASANDGIWFRVASVTADTLTLHADDAVTAEGPIATTITVDFVQHALDDYEEWPGPFAAEAGRTNLVRSGGFSGGLVLSAGVADLFTSTSFEVTANATAADSVAGTDEYDWFLSQRSESASGQLLSIVQYDPSAVDTYSGTVTIDLSAVGTGLYGASLTVDEAHEVFSGCHLYCRRKSDGAIQWVDLLKALTDAT